MTFLVGAQGAAHAAPTCTRMQAKPDGYRQCYTVVSMRKRTTTVESVPVVNSSKVKVKASCKFTRTITRTITGTAGYKARAKAGVLKLAEVEGEWSVSASLSQTKSQASEVAGSFTLKPGQKVTCVRTYGYVQMTVDQYDHWDVGNQIRNRKRYTVKVPSSLGVTFV